jgi:hypothetical protein
MSPPHLNLGNQELVLHKFWVVSIFVTWVTRIPDATKVNVSIPVPDPYPCPTIAPISDSFSPICAHACFYSQGCNQCKCMTWLNVTGHYSLHGNGCNLQTQIAIYNDLLWKFISNSYYFRKIYFLQVTSLHPKFYMPIFLWDVESSPNYTENLIFAGIGTITLYLTSTISWMYVYVDK